MSNNYGSGWLMRFGAWKFFADLGLNKFWGPVFSEGHVEDIIRPFKIDKTCVQMIPRVISGTFQPIIDFCYGLTWVII